VSQDEEVGGNFFNFSLKKEKASPFHVFIDFRLLCASLSLPPLFRFSSKGEMCKSSVSAG